MVGNESIEKLVDRLVNKFEKETVADTPQIKNEQQLPFRYLTDNDEIKSVLTSKVKTIINVPEEAKMVDGTNVLSGLGDTTTIERVIQKHIQTRKFENK
ncbi:MAG: hypothetical protein U9O49_03825 [Candidatus Thermoplasmatota archaeon]|nr:hypothetical protein [Candidatus Thermoplasmatota archaeon]